MYFSRFPKSQKNSIANCFHPCSQVGSVLQCRDPEFGLHTMAFCFLGWRGQETLPCWAAPWKLWATWSGWSCLQGVGSLNVPSTPTVPWVCNSELLGRLQAPLQALPKLTWGVAFTGRLLNPWKCSFYSWSIIAPKIAVGLHFIGTYAPPQIFATLYLWLVFVLSLFFFFSSVHCWKQNLFAHRESSANS